MKPLQPWCAAAAIETDGTAPPNSAPARARAPARPAGLARPPPPMPPPLLLSAASATALLLTPPRRALLARLQLLPRRALAAGRRPSGAPARAAGALCTHPGVGPAVPPAMRVPAAQVADAGLHRRL
mgnify:CR=1 FL=1